MAQMNVSLPDGLKAWAESRVAGGDYSSTSDYVRDLMRRDRERRAHDDRLRGEIQVGLDSGLAEVEPEDIIAELIQGIDVRADAKAAA